MILIAVRQQIHLLDEGIIAEEELDQELYRESLTVHGINLYHVPNQFKT